MEMRIILMSLLMLIALVTVNGSNSNNNENRGQLEGKRRGPSGNFGVNSISNLRQTSFFEWLVSIFRPGRPTTTTTNSTTPRECAQCSCGSANNITRIVGGQETRVQQYPWMAMLRNRNFMYCGGSLINDLYVVTAAHCVQNIQMSLVTVRLLAHTRSNSDNLNVIDRGVKQVFIHENYSRRNLDNDIALIKLSEPIKFNEKLRPVCMPQADNLYVHEEGIVVGWGALSQGGAYPERLQEVRVPILSQEECYQSTYGRNRITDNMLCAGKMEGGQDSCQGDSGGPLHVKNEETEAYHLPGIVSWGDGCARPNTPGVYTRVTRYLYWIEDRTQDACKCRTPIERET